MENVQILIPIEPSLFWKQLKAIIEEVVEQHHSPNMPVSGDRPYGGESLLKISEVCKLFKVSKPTIYEWLKQRKLKSVKIESRRYIQWQDIDELIKGSTGYSL